MKDILLKEIYDAPYISYMFMVSFIIIVFLIIIIVCLYKENKFLHKF